MRLEQHVRVRVAGRGLEAIGRKLDQETQRIVEVDRVHEAAVLDARVLDPALVEAFDRLRERRLRDREREVVHEAGLTGRGVGSGSRSSFVNTVISRPSPGSK